MFAETRAERQPRDEISLQRACSYRRGGATNGAERWNARTQAKLRTNSPRGRGEVVVHLRAQSEFDFRMNPPAFESSQLELLAPLEAEPRSGVETSRRGRIEVAPAELLRLLYRQMSSLAGPRADIEDIVQAAAERAWKALPRFEGRAALSTWTYGIAYRTLLDHDRWYRRFRRRFQPAANDDPEPSDDRDSEVRLREKERAQRLHGALAHLPAAKRAVIVLHDLEGMDISDIALVVKSNELTVRSRLRDARKKLAALLLADPLFDAEGGE